jgi:cell wall-associated NlpC family hydrolase
MLPGQTSAVYVKAVTVALDGVVAASSGENIVKSAAQLSGTPYLWGGMSSQGIDCSGLVYTVYRLYGWELPRDADQQFEVGAPVGRKELEPGDLLFFGKDSNDITHVGIYQGEGNMLHASGSIGVGVSPLTDYDYKFQGARRVLGATQAERLRIAP